MVGQVAFFCCELPCTIPFSFPADFPPLVSAGLQTGNTVISSYIVDCYPSQSMSIITFYSVILDTSALANPVSADLVHLNKFANLGTDQIPVLHRSLGYGVGLYENICCSRHHYLLSLRPFHFFDPQVWTFVEGEVW
jgi:hypothetical protein